VLDVTEDTQHRFGVLPGSPNALLHRGPLRLRDRTCTFPRIRLKQAQRLVAGQKC